jgi:DNA modification methylase
MCRDAANVSAEILESKPALNFQIFQTGSEKWSPEPRSLDFVFTSPPYFDAEKYYDEPGQCWRDYPDRPRWIQNYLVPTLKSARLGLKEGRTLLLNVSSSMRQEIVECAQSVGFSLQEEFSHLHSQDHFHRGGSKGRKEEVFLAFT